MGKRFNEATPLLQRATDLTAPPPIAPATDAKDASGTKAAKGVKAKAKGKGKAGGGAGGAVAGTRQGAWGRLEPWWLHSDVREIYLNLGDALLRDNNESFARVVFDKGAAAGLFESPWQRPVHVTAGIRSAPVWKREDDPAVAKVLDALEANVKTIQAEAQRILDIAGVSTPLGLGGTGAADSLVGGHFSPAHSLLVRDSSLLTSWWAAIKNGLPGREPWSQFFFFEHGLKDYTNCNLAPRTCALAESLGAAESIYGDAKLSLMSPGTEVRRNPHRCYTTRGQATGQARPGQARLYGASSFTSICNFTTSSLCHFANATVTCNCRLCHTAAPQTGACGSTWACLALKGPTSRWAMVTS